MLDFTLMTAASKADVTILRFESWASASKARGFFPDGELADSVKLPCFSTLIAPIGFPAPVGDTISDSSCLKRTLLLCISKALMALELKFASARDGVYK